jgi:beta-ureidopropionase / N-carbamoyl-L-amino-acid hydrolase
MISVNRDRLLADLRDLARIGQYQTGVDRIAFSPADIEARQWLAARFRAAGLETSIDRFGTVYGAAPNARRSILIGSHSDTVPRGGWLDGALGVIYALEIARAVQEAGASGVGVDAVSFQDEEGTYFAFLGSLSLIDALDPQAMAVAQSTDGHKLSDAIKSAGLNGEPRRLEPGRQIAFLEAHIEQGPRLEHAGNRIGIVTGIVGIRRLRIVSQGRADHAGTTPMAMRRDALAPLLRFGCFVADRFPALAGPDTVWNIGRIEAMPGAANVVPTRAQLILEFRDTEVALLDRMEQEVAREIARLNAAGADIEREPIATIAPTAMDARLAETFERAATDLGYPTQRMASGAGHDAMIMARRIPSAMIFVPSIGGRSHDVAENTKDDDIVAGCMVMARAVERLTAA